MLVQLRHVTRGFFAMAILGLLALAFAVWGISDVFHPVQSNEVASGRGVSVKDTEFAKSFDNEFKAAQAQAKSQGAKTPTKQDAFAANFHMQVLDRLITQRVFDHLAQKTGIDTSDRTIEAEVRANPVFQNQVTAAFDPNTYKQILAQNGFSRSQYEENLRRDMTRVQLAHALAAGVRTPDAFAQMVYAFESEKRTFAVAAISPDRVPTPPAPTEAELNDFYKATSRAFALPEMRSMTIVRAEPSLFEPKVDVPEEKIKQLFDFRKASLATPEKRTFVILSGPDPSRAQQAAARLAKGEDPDAVARAVGMQIVKYAQKAKTDVPDTKVADAVFALAAGKTSAPIQGIAWSVARIDAVAPAVTPNYDEARGLLRTELARDEAQSMLDDAVEKFEDARSGGAALEDAAKQAGLEVSVAPLVDARGLNEKGAPDASVLDQPELLKAAFSASQGEPTDWISTDDGGSFLVRVDKVRPTGAPPLAQIKDQVANAWRFKQIGEAMARIAEDVKKAVAAGQPFADVVRAQRLQIMAQPQEVDRRSARQGPMAPLAPEVFSAQQGEVVSAIGGPGNRFLLLAQVTKITRGDPKTSPQEVAQIRALLAQGLANDVLASAQNGARQAARIKLNQALIDRTVGKTNEPDAGS